MKSLKKRLKNNELTIGSWVTLPHPSIVEILASAGFDWLAVDIEHSSIGFESLQMLIMTIQAQNIPALVRVSSNDEVVIKRVLDLGANGIIVPMVNSALDVTKAINYAHYPPKGKRGVGLYRAQKYGIGFEEYKKQLDEELVIVGQVEHIDAVHNLNEIIANDDLDATIIGPYDLSASMGLPGNYSSPEVQEAINLSLEICKKAKKPCGFHVIESDPQKTVYKISQGCSFLAYSIDFLFLGDKAREGLNFIKKEAL